LISDEGAIELAEFITYQDFKLTKIVLTRNRIRARGGDILLEAVTNTIRLTNFKVAYGNEIDVRMESAFEQEILSNL
jgi:hypothetical protein